MTASSAVEVLRAALAVVRPRAADLTEEDLSLLRARVGDAVDEMRAEGLPAREAVQAVKGLATDAGVQWISIELVDQLASWCNERYPEPTTE